MNLKSNKTYFLWPFRGLLYFITHPNLWAVAIFAVILLFILLAIIFFVILFIFWPEGWSSFGHSLWELLKGFGYSSAGVLIGFIILMPLLVTLALDKMVRKILILEEGNVIDVTFFKSIYSSSIIFFKTFFWRFFWPVVGIISAVFLGPVGAFISQLGIGHLAVIDAVDLTLALKGTNTKERLYHYHEKRSEIFCMGFFAGILSMILSMTLIGWLLWIPAVFCGATLWVKDWPLLRNNK